VNNRIAQEYSTVGKPVILVVDDEKNIRLTLRESLKTFNAQVDAAVNGEEALDMAAQQEYDLVLLDLKMPGMDGMEVLRRLRELSPGTAVILLTAHGTVEAAVEAMKLGAVDFLQKPFAPKEIRDIVTRVLGRQKQRKEKPDDYGYFTDSAREHIRNSGRGGCPGNRRAHCRDGPRSRQPGDLPDCGAAFRRSPNPRTGQRSGQHGSVSEARRQKRRVANAPGLQVD
jgi:CheY-like chemotaxis protein